MTWLAIKLEFCVGFLPIISNFKRAGTFLPSPDPQISSRNGKLKLRLKSWPFQKYISCDPYKEKLVKCHPDSMLAYNLSNFDPLPIIRFSNKKNFKATMNGPLPRLPPPSPEEFAILMTPFYSARSHLPLQLSPSRNPMGGLLGVCKNGDQVGLCWTPYEFSRISKFLKTCTRFL